MSFELKPKVSVSKSLLHIAQRELKRARRQVTRQQFNSRDKVVNAAQKSIQKSRALLYLVRPAIGEKAFRREDDLLRDVTRPLDVVHSARAFVGIIDKIADQYEDQITERTFHNIRNFLHARHLAARKTFLTEQNALDSVANVARNARQRVRRWAKLPNQWRTIGKGLEQTYGSALESYVDASIDPSVAKLNAWREKLVLLRYQLRLLRPVWPARMHELIDESKRLGILLGECRDLAALHQLLSETQHVSGSKDLDVLIALIHQRRSEFTRQAILLGARFFQDKPKPFARRLKEQWKAWRGQSNVRKGPPEVVRMPDQPQKIDIR